MADEASTMFQLQETINAKNVEIQKITSESDSAQVKYRQDMGELQKSRESAVYSQKALTNENGNLRKQISDYQKTSDKKSQKDQTDIKKQAAEISKLQDRCKKYFDAQKEITDLKLKLDKKEEARAALSEIMKKEESNYKMDLEYRVKKCASERQAAEADFESRQKNFIAMKTNEIQMCMNEKQDLVVQLNSAQDLKTQCERTNDELNKEIMSLNAQINKEMVEVKNCMANGTSISSDCAIKLQSFETKTQELKDQAREEKEKYNDAERKISQLENKLVEKTKLYETTVNNVQRECDNEVKKLTNEKVTIVNNSETTISKMKTDHITSMNNMRNEMERKDQDYKKLQTLKTESEKNLTGRAKADIAKLQAKTDEFQRKLTNTTQERSRFESKTQSLEKQLKDNDDKIFQLNKKMNEQTNMYQRQTSKSKVDADLCQSRVGELNKQIKDFESLRKQDQSKMSTQNNEFVNLHREMTQLQNQYDTTSSQYQNCTVVNNTISNETIKCKDQMEKLRTQMMQNEIGERQLQERLSEVQDNFASMTLQYKEVSKQLEEANKTNIESRRKQTELEGQLSNCKYNENACANEVTNIQKSIQAGEARQKSLSDENMQVTNKSVECAARFITAKSAQEELIKQLSLAKSTVEKLTNEKKRQNTDSVKIMDDTRKTYDARLLEMEKKIEQENTARNQERANHDKSDAEKARKIEERNSSQIDTLSSELNELTRQVSTLRNNNANTPGDTVAERVKNRRQENKDSEELEKRIQKLQTKVRQSSR